MDEAPDFSLHLRRAYLAIHRVANARFQALGITADQYVVLTALKHLERPTQQKLVDRIASDPNTIRALLKRLEERGLVERQPHATDRRAVSVSLTQAGLALQQHLEEIDRPFQDFLFGLFSSDDRTKLLGQLDHIAGSMKPTPRRRKHGVLP